MAAPTNDPFSPHFTGPFQGIPTRTLPTDTLAFTLHILPPSPPALTALLTSVRTLTVAWTRDYIWQRTPLTISLAPDGTHLHGTLEYGDSIDDEWFAVSILREASRQNPEAWIRVWDSDGEFLLIEAAHALPRWLNPDVATHRVWIKQGKLWIIPMVRGLGKREMALDEALRFLQMCTMEALLRDRGIEREALARTRGYPEAAGKHLHRARILVPRRIAAVLRARPESVAAAVESFYVRDPVSLKALRKGVGERRFPWRDTVEISARFTKVLFAQLKGQMWISPFEAGFPSTEEGKTDVGVKVTAGFEMLLARENDVLLTSDARRATVEELRALLDAGLQEPSDEEIATWSKEEDGEEWLHIDFTEFEKDLKGAKGGGGAGRWGDVEQEGKLKQMVERVEAFLNDDTAGPEGAVFNNEEELNSDDDLTDSDDDDDDGEDKTVSFDEEEFERMMREMMGLPPDLPTKEEQEEEVEIKRVQDQIEQELKVAGAIEREAPKVQELADSQDGDDSEDDYDDDDDSEVNIDYTLAKNLLASFKGQGGLSGPTGTLLARMGMVLPRDEPEEEVQGKGKGKRWLGRV